MPKYKISSSRKSIVKKGEKQGEMNKEENVEAGTIISVDSANNENITILNDDVNVQEGRRLVAKKTRTNQKRKSNKNINIEEVINTFYEELFTLREQFTEIRVKHKELSQKFTEYNNSVNAFEKLANKTIKDLQKSKRTRKTNGDRAPTGFEKPTPITAELATFLEKPTDYQMSRVDVGRAITNYIKKHNLQNPQNGKYIIPDQALATLFRLEENEQFSFFQMQAKMKHLFAKTAETKTNISMTNHEEDNNMLEAVETVEAV